MFLHSRRLLLLSFLLPGLCLAQELNAHLVEKSKSELFHDLMQNPHIADSLALREAISGIYIGASIPKYSGADLRALMSIAHLPDTSATQALQRELVERETAGKSPEIIKHIRSQRGVPFPAERPVDKRIFTESESYKQALKINQKLMSKEMFDVEFSAPKLPKCEYSKTMGLPLPNSQGSPLQNAPMDVLFLSEPPPLDAAEIFGKNTHIYEYSTQTRDYISYLSGYIGVHCLPFRVRQTESHVFWDMGLNALKNYESDPNGQGEFHAYIQAKYNIP